MFRLNAKDARALKKQELDQLTNINNQLLTVWKLLLLFLSHFYSNKSLKKHPQIDWNFLVRPEYHINIMRVHSQSEGTAENHLYVIGGFKY